MMKKSSRMKTILLAGVLAVGMCLSSMTAMAETVIGDKANVSQDLTKVLQLPEGASIPAGGLKFEFTFEAVDGTGDDGLTYTDGVADKASAAEISIGEGDNKNSITFTRDDYDKDDWDEGEYKGSVDPEPTHVTFEKGLYSVSKSEDLKYKYTPASDPTPKEGGFLHAGKYAYKVTEKASTVTGLNDDANETVTYDTNKYTLYVYVGTRASDGSEDSVPAVGHDGQSDLVVKNVTLTAWNVDPAQTESQDPPATNTKLGDLVFTNLFSKSGNGDTPDPEGDGHDNSLVISKMVDGSYGSTNDEFTFELTLTKSGTVATPENDTTLKYTAKKIGTDNQEVSGFKFEGKNNGNVYIKTTGTSETYKFTLKANEKLVFEELPAGTRYTVKEQTADGYTTKTNVMEDGTSVEVQSGTPVTEGDTLLVGEKVNTVVFTNTASDIAITGIFMDILPFAILIAAAAAGLTVYVVVRKKVRAAR